MRFELGHFFRLRYCQSVQIVVSVSCVRNSSYLFMPVVLKLYRCFCHGLKMCMRFDYGPQINIYHFSRIFTWSFVELQYYQTVYIVGTFGGVSKGGKHKLAFAWF